MLFALMIKVGLTRRLRAVQSNQISNEKRFSRQFYSRFVGVSEAGLSGWWPTSPSLILTVPNIRCADVGNRAIYEADRGANLLTTNCPNAINVCTWLSQSHN